MESLNKEMGSQATKEKIGRKYDESVGMFPFKEEKLGREEEEEDNSCGLPEDVLAMIAVIVAREDMSDMAAFAQVCKTWRRVSYKDSVWRTLAIDLDIKVRENESLRAQVLSSWYMGMDENFAFLPSWCRMALKKDFLFDVSDKVRVCVVNGQPQFCSGGGVGKTSMIIRFVNDFFAGETYFETLGEESYDVLIGGMAHLSIMDTSGKDINNILLDGPIRECDAIIVCDTFDDLHCVEHISMMYERIVQNKNDIVPVAVMIVRTKADVGMPFVARAQVMSFCKQYQLPFYSCSAKTGTNIRRLFYDMYLFSMEKKLKKSKKK